MDTVFVERDIDMDWKENLDGITDETLESDLDEAMKDVGWCVMASLRGMTHGPGPGGETLPLPVRIGVNVLVATRILVEMERRKELGSYGEPHESEGPLA